MSTPCGRTVQYIFQLSANILIFDLVAETVQKGITSVIGAHILGNALVMEMLTAQDSL